MYEGFRVPQDSARAALDSTRVPQGSTMLHQGFVVRPSSEKPSDQDRFAHGRNTKQNRNQWLLAYFHCLVTCSLAQANVGFVANQITSLRNSRCSRVNAWHCCLVGFGFQEFHEAARAMRSEGFHQILQKYGAALRKGSSKVCLGPIGPNCAIAPRSGPSGPVNCTKLASPSFAIDTVAIRILRKTGVEL